MNKKRKFCGGLVKKCLALVLSLMMILGTTVNVMASDPLSNYLPGWPQMTDITPVSACLIDADNGAILYSLNRDEIRTPASITKIMTCLLAIENTQMTDIVTIGQEAMDVAVSGNSNCAPTLGEQFTVEQCLYMLMLKSANDIAVQLAIQVAGSVDAFSNMMNERAAKAGALNTHFHNPSGLPDDQHWTTAYDMAMIMRECLKNETFRKLIATQTYTVPPTNYMSESRYYENHNQLIMTNSEFYYPNCIGGKTGYTDAALRTLVCAASRDGRTLVGVTMGAADRTDFADMKSLFEYGFNQFSTTEVNDGTYEGSVTLPNGVGTDQVTMQDSGRTYEDGRPIMDLIYAGQNKVGEAAEPAKAAASDSENEEAIEGQGDDGTAGTDQDGAHKPTKTKGKINLLFIGAVVLALLALLILLVLIMEARAEKKRREMARRRARARKRAAAERRRREQERDY